ncbi:MAG: hypothetical protein RLZZ135_424 [Cyanobacteriota bacterium]|jgi:hypothetical protein
MCTDKSNEDDADVITHMNDEAIFITLNIKDCPIIRNDAGIGINTFNICGTLLISLSDIINPRSQCWFHLCMNLPKFS